MAPQVHSLGSGLSPSLSLSRPPPSLAGGRGGEVARLPSHCWWSCSCRPRRLPCHGHTTNHQHCGCVCTTAAWAWSQCPALTVLSPCTVAWSPECPSWRVTPKHNLAPDQCRVIMAETQSTGAVLCCAGAGSSLALGWTQIKTVQATAGLGWAGLAGLGWAGLGCWEHISRHSVLKLPCAAH